MQYPDCDLYQKPSICNRYIELFRLEHNEHYLGADVKAKRAEFDALMPEEYHTHRIVWLAIKWKDVLNGNDDLGFPGVELSDRLAATEKKNEVYQAWLLFAKWQRDEHGPTVKRLLYERHKAMEECRQDGEHNPSLADFSTVNGKKRLNVPEQNPHNEATSVAFAMRTFEKIPNMDMEHRKAVFEAIAEAKHYTRNSDHWDSRLNKALVRININNPEPPDPIEDFNTYTKIGGASVVITSPKVAFTVTRSEETYVYKDFGIDHFSGDFSHLCDGECTAATAPVSSAVAYFWNLTNDLDDVKGLLDANKSFLTCRYNYNTAGNFLILLEEVNSGTFYNDLYVGALNTHYWFTIGRDEAIGSFGQLENLIHSDVDRITLLDTLAVLLHTSKKNFRYQMSLNTYNNGAAASTITGYIQNLDLQEVAAGSPWHYYTQQQIGG